MTDPASVEAAVLRTRPRLTRQEVADAAGVELAWAQRLWRALGYPDVGDGPAVFTDTDVDALRRLAELVDAGVVDAELAVSLTRAMGHTAARLASWQVDAMAEQVARTTQATPDEAARVAAIRLAEHADDLELLFAHVWRRQLAASVARLSAEQQVGDRAGHLTVGFADLVSYTRLAQRLDEHELGVLVDRFEALGSDVVGEHGGRVVKTVGDEILFVADRPAVAAEIALSMSELLAHDEVLPQVRIGLATGPVVFRLGDVYGTVVNLASRLTGMALAGTVLVDRATAEGLAGDDRYRLDDERVRAVRGLGLVHPGILRRAEPPPTDLPDLPDLPDAPHPPHPPHPPDPGQSHAET